MISGVYNLGGLNIGINPMLLEDGQFIHLENIDTDPIGAKVKRPGLVSYLGTPDTSIVRSLFNWTKQNGTQFWNYRYSGSRLYYSTQGTGAWTVCGNGTFSGGTILGNAVLEETLIVGDGVNATRHSTTGTNFTDTTSAPIAPYFAEYQNRIYAGGTSSDLFYSTTGTASDWTSDSSSYKIPGGGRINGLFKIADRLTVTKNSGAIIQWDGFNLVDTATELGPSSPQSVAKLEDFSFWFNRLGMFAYRGVTPQIFSNPIQDYIYNNRGTPIAGDSFDTAAGATYKYNYYLAVGDIDDEFQDDIVNKAVIVYNYQQNELYTYSMSSDNDIRSMLAYKDQNGIDRFLMGASDGQVFTFGGTAVTDNDSLGGTFPITAKAEYVWHGKTLLEKKFNYIRLLFNPGMEGQIQIAVANTLALSSRNYITLGQAIDGIVEFHFPSSSRGRFLFIRIIDSSRTVAFKFYGFEIDFEVLQHG